MSSESDRPTAKAENLVTIIVACCGQLEYTRLCVPSLLRFSRPPYELIFLDSDSLDGTKEYLEGVAIAAPVRVDVLSVPTDVADLKGRKEENMSVRGGVIVLMNNDVIVSRGWIECLLQTAESDPAIGMVAPMSNMTSGDLLVDHVPYGLEEFLSETYKKGTAIAAVEKVNQFAKGWAKQHKGQSFGIEQIAGGCVLLKRDVLQQLGLAPTRTPLGTFDLGGLSQRSRGLGYRLVGCKEVFVHYFGSRTATRR